MQVVIVLTCLKTAVDGSTFFTAPLQNTLTSLDEDTYIGDDTISGPGRARGDLEKGEGLYGSI